MSDNPNPDTMPQELFGKRIVYTDETIVPGFDPSKLVLAHPDEVYKARTPFIVERREGLYYLTNKTNSFQIPLTLEQREGKFYLVSADQRISILITFDETQS